MNYQALMKDCVSYINAHPKETYDAETLGKIYSIKGEYLSWMFQCYYKESLETFLENKDKLEKIGRGGNFPLYQKEEMYRNVRFA